MTKILFIEEDAVSFEIRRCIAAVLECIQPIQMFHAKDASEGLELMEQLAPDVVIIQHDEEAERELFLDGLHKAHPPVIVDNDQGANVKVRRGVTYCHRDGTLEGIHQLLKTATKLAALGSASTDVAQ